MIAREEFITYYSHLKDGVPQKRIDLSYRIPNDYFDKLHRDNHLYHWHHRWHQRGEGDRWLFNLRKYPQGFQLHLQARSHGCDLDQ